MDVVSAIREQNVQVAAGVVGASPSVPGVPLELSVNARGRLINESEFEDIVVKSELDGATTYLKDVARVELAASEYARRSMIDNKPAISVSVNEAPSANSLQIADDVRTVMAELSKDFPNDVEYQIVYDPTRLSAPASRQ